MIWAAFVPYCIIIRGSNCLSQDKCGTSLVLLIVREGVFGGVYPCPCICIGAC